MKWKKMKCKAKMNTSYFNVVKPQRGNIHGLIPQPPVKQSNMNERDTHTQITQLLV